MIRVVDDWWAANQLVQCFAQIGDTTYRPKHIPFKRSLAPAAYESKIRESKLVVAHAGMGSILTAMRLSKPILIFPRRGDLQETRNNHQLATIRHFRGLEGIYVAENEVELLEQLSNLNQPIAPPSISPYASDQLLNRLSSFIDGQADVPANQAVYPAK